jgi:hypothetical protein
VKRAELAAWLLVATQVVHGFIPAETESEGYAGAIGGLILLVASLAAVYGLRTSKSWAPTVLMVTGAAVAVGFVAYHATPVRSAVTNPYLGEPVGVPAWIGVAVAVGSGTWAWWEGRQAREAAPVGR